MEIFQYLIIKVLESTKAWGRCVMYQAGWRDGHRGTDRQLTVSLSTFGEKEDQQLPDEPHSDDEKEKEEQSQFTAQYVCTYQIHNGNVKTQCRKGPDYPNNILRCHI